MASMKNWMQAMRLRTLPLALASIVLGIALAYAEGPLNGPVLLLTLLTALQLQVLSNLANDYGDGLSGVDTAARQGPQRVLQAGLISAQGLKRALYGLTVVTFFSGLLLLWQARLSLVAWLILLAVGLAAIVAAITYTIGRRPYGYAGLGDLAVFIFFGLVAVGGGYFLQTGDLGPSIWLPATVAGLLCTAVLNVNNIRDIETDLAAGKVTLAARLGRVRACLYQGALILGAIGLGLFYLFATAQGDWFFSYLLVPGLLWHLYRLFGAHSGEAYNLKLKQMVLLATLYELTFAVDIVM